MVNTGMGLCVLPQEADRLNHAQGSLWAPRTPFFEALDGTKVGIYLAVGSEFESTLDMGSGLWTRSTGLSTGWQGVGSTCEPMGPAPALHSSGDLDGHRGHVPPKPLADLVKATQF